MWGLYPQEKELFQAGMSLQDILFIRAMKINKMSPEFMKWLDSDAFSGYYRYPEGGPLTDEELNARTEAGKRIGRSKGHKDFNDNLSPGYDYGYPWPKKTK